MGVHGAYGGAILVDGSWHCPATPKAHKDATPLYRDGEISKEEWEDRLKRRAEHYLLRAKEAPRSNGGSAHKCPAVGPGATVNCPLKPRAPQREGDKERTTILRQDLPAHPGPVCTNHNSVTIPLAAGAKYAQSVVWQSEEWHRVYGSRNTVEAKNAYLKDEKGGSIAAHGRRLLRGIAVQSVLVAIMVAGQNVRAVQDYLRRPRTDDGPDTRPPSPPRSRRSRRSRRSAKRGAALADLLEPSTAPPVAA